MTELELEIRESSVDDTVIVDCPICLDPMLLGKNWTELILEDVYDIPECPDCDDGEGDSWVEDADVKLDGVEYWALSGDVIKTVPIEGGAEGLSATGGDQTDV